MIAWRDMVLEKKKGKLKCEKFWEGNLRKWACVLLLLCCFVVIENVRETDTDRLFHLSLMWGCGVGLNQRE
jgi:hypothetical protein